MAKSPAWQRKEGKNPKGGLNAKGRASYKGGTLKAPVKAETIPGERASWPGWVACLDQSVIAKANQPGCCCLFGPGEQAARQTPKRKLLQSRSAIKRRHKKGQPRGNTAGQPFGVKGMSSDDETTRTSVYPQP